MTTASTMDWVEARSHIHFLKAEGVIKDYSTENFRPDSASGYKMRIALGNGDVLGPLSLKEVRAFIYGARVAQGTLTKG